MKLKIKRWGINGEGIGYKNRKAIFVENAIPEELVDVQITDDKKTYALAKVNEVMEPSPRRRHPICPLWKECGGCSLMHVDYKGQVRMKESSLREALKKYAGYTGPIEPLMKNPDPLGYRNAFKLPVRKVKGIISTGMFAKNTNDFVKVNRCLIHSKKLETVRSEINELMNKHSLPVANEDGYGLLNIVAKEFDGQVHVVFITTDMELPEAFVDDVMSLENTASVWQSIKSEADPEFELFGKQVMHIAGEMNMSLHLKDYQINLLPRSFFQLNTKQALAVYETVADMIPKHSSLMVEAYSGVGGISLFCADKADQVIGIESIEDAVANANENALMNGKENVKFECGDAAKVLSRISRSNRIDTLVVDPPRAGLNQEMRHAILKAAPETLIYVSCNPSTLAKDIHDLQGMYKIEKVQPIDMFSQTPHVETVVLMSRIKA